VEKGREAMIKTALIAVDGFECFDYGPTHPLRMYRLKLTWALMEAYRLTGLPNMTVIKPRPATEKEVLSFHRPEYVEALKRANSGLWFDEAYRYGLGGGDCPIFKGLYEGSLLGCGGSVVVAEKLISGAAHITFNIAGGLHHAMPNYASGFCYLNDPVVAINKLLEHFSKVAYVDIDAHHGDGVQFAYYRSNRVLTISIHESPLHLFPGRSGFIEELGEDEGYGYSVNLPLLPYAGDDVFLKAFDEVVIPLLHAYNPDVLVTQLGVDTFQTDPLTHMELTTNAFCHAIRAFKALGKPWLALGGGGYDVANVCRGWTLAWAIMNGVELPDEVPQEWNEQASAYNVRLSKLRDGSSYPSSKSALQDVEKVISYLKETLPYTS